MSKGVGLFNDTKSKFYLDYNNDSKADSSFGFGPPDNDWSPVAGDFNGDGESGVGLYNGNGFLLDTNKDGKTDTTVGLGPVDNDWKPVAGDFDGDGVDDVGLYNGNGFLLDTNKDGKTDTTVGLGPVDNDWKPVAGNWEGNTLIGTNSDDVFGPKSEADYRTTDKDEVIKAKGGNDKIDAAGGDDIISGGSGSDIFQYSLGDGLDTITDFQISPESGTFDIVQFSKDILISDAGSDIKFAENSQEISQYFDSGHSISTTLPDSIPEKGSMVLQTSFEMSDGGGVNFDLEVDVEELSGVPGDVQDYAGDTIIMQDSNPKDDALEPEIVLGDVTYTGIKDEFAQIVDKSMSNIDFAL